MPAASSSSPLIVRVSPVDSAQRCPQESISISLISKMSEERLRRKEKLKRCRRTLQFGRANRSSLAAVGLACIIEPIVAGEHFFRPKRTQCGIPQKGGGTAEMVDNGLPA